MDDTDAATTAAGGAGRRRATVTDVQLVMAEAQRAMAQALLALSRGQTAPVDRRAAAGDIETFPHTGVLDFTADRGLFFTDAEGACFELEALAAQEKSVRLTLKLDANAVAAQTASSQQLLAALSDFVRNRTATAIVMDAQCDPN